MGCARSLRFNGAVALALACAACRAGGQGEPVENGALEEPVVNLPAVPRPEPALDRAGLLAAVAQAASLSASGAADTRSARLDGRPFQVRIRFGCKGPTEDFEQAWLGWSYDSERRRLRVHARPTISAEDPLVKAAHPSEVEAVEGFWIPRPWLLDAVCPAGAALAPEPDQPPPGNIAQEQPEAPAVADPVPRGPRVGIAQFYTESDPRTGRRGDRAFEAIKTLDEDQPLRSQGFNLVLSGRLRALPGGRVIGCSSQGADSPPECIVSADFDRVWIENPDSGEIVAEWGSS